MLKSDRSRSQLEMLKATVESIVAVSNDKTIIENNEVTVFFNNEDCLRSFVLLRHNS